MPGKELTFQDRKMIQEGIEHNSSVLSIAATIKKTQKYCFKRNTEKSSDRTDRFN